MDTKMLKGLVTIVIPNYNQEKFVARAVASALSQSYENIEVIVVDDGSTDGSLDVLKQFNSSIKLLLKENGGAASARNLGMNQSRGEFICFLDADDYFAENFIASQLRVLRESGNKLVYCRMTIVDSEEKSIGYSKEDRSGNFKSIFQREFGSTPFPPSSILINSSIVDIGIEWNTRIKRAEDYEFIGLCALYTDISFNNKSLVFHTEHSGSLTSKTTVLYLFDNLTVMRNLLIAYHNFNPLSWAKGFFKVLKIYILSVFKEKLERK